MNTTLTRKLSRTCLVTLIAGLLTACGPMDGDPADPPSPTNKTVSSDKKRVMNPSVQSNDLDLQVAGSNAFAFDVYRKLSTTPRNLFYSPHSISMALAMTYAGAKNYTEHEMAKALRYDLPQSKLHPVFNALDQELASRGKGAKGADGKAFRLNVVNAIWGQTGFSFLTSFLDTLALNYGAGLRLLDFVNFPEVGRKEINTWVEAKTEGRIKDLLVKGDVDAGTRLVLTNAIYFNAAWETHFDVKDTKPATFTRADGSAVTVQMMSGSKQSRKYLKGSGFEAAELPYHGDELSMLVIMPDAGKLSTFEQTLDSKKVDTIIQQLNSTIVHLKMPRFGTEGRMSLRQVLSMLGMPSAFGGAADFSGIDGTGGLFIADVLHKAFIKVDEKGTEAAAATAVPMSWGLPQPASLTIDRPFIYLIRDHKTKAILFVGRVMDPTAK